MRNDQLEIQPEYFEYELEATLGEMENGFGEGIRRRVRRV